MGKYVVAWLLGVPAFVLVIVYMLRALTAVFTGRAATGEPAVRLRAASPRRWPQLFGHARDRHRFLAPCAVTTHSRIRRRARHLSGTLPYVCRLSPRRKHGGPL